jgi:hypothetical protein
MSCIPKSLRPSCLRAPEREPSDKRTSSGASESGSGSPGTSRTPSFGGRLSARLKRKESKNSKASDESRRSTIGSLMSKFSNEKNKTSADLSNKDNSDIAFFVPIVDGEDFFKGEEVPLKKTDLALGDSSCPDRDDAYLLFHQTTHPRSDSFSSIEDINPSDYYTSDDESDVGVIKVEYQQEDMVDLSNLIIPKINENADIKNI